MIPEKHKKALVKIQEELCDKDIDWVLAGSMGIALQGVDTEVGDIDILTDKAGAYKIEELFSEKVVKEVKWREVEKFRSYYGILQIEGIHVEIMGNLEIKNREGEWENELRNGIENIRTFIELRGRKIPVLPLEMEYESYLKLNRNEKAEIIKRKIEKG